jgi:chromosome segregation ATPase
VNAWQTVAAILGGGGVAGFLGSLLTGLLNRPKVRAEAVSLLTDAALKQVNELQERTTEAEQAAVSARREAAEARAEAAAARRHVAVLSAEVEACVARLRQWRNAILRPSVTIEELREMVAAEPGQNGQVDT